MKVRLLDIAHARSGDKGDTANVGVIARRPEWYPILVQYLTLDAVREHFRGVITGDVERFELPNLNALNFLLHGALDGGGTLSLKTDAQGKVYSTALLRLVLDVPGPGGDGEIHDDVAEDDRLGEPLRRDDDRAPGIGRSPAGADGGQQRQRPGARRRRHPRV